MQYFTYLEKHTDIYFSSNQEICNANVWTTIEITIISEITQRLNYNLRLIGQYLNFFRFQYDSDYTVKFPISIRVRFQFRYLQTFTVYTYRNMNYNIERC